MPAAGDHPWGDFHFHFFRFELAALRKALPAITVIMESNGAGAGDLIPVKVGVLSFSAVNTAGSQYYSDQAFSHNSGCLGTTEF
jgi:hypothetical protein